MEIQIKTNALGELYLQDTGGKVTRLYRFREALALARISAVTYYMWVKRGLIADTRLRDRGQWRVFTESEMRDLMQLAQNQSDKTTGWQLSRPLADRLYNWRESP